MDDLTSSTSTGRRSPPSARAGRPTARSTGGSSTRCCAQPRVIAYDVEFRPGRGTATALAGGGRRAGDRIVLGATTFELHGAAAPVRSQVPAGRRRCSRGCGARAGYVGFPLGGGEVFRRVEADVSLRPDPRRVPTLSFRIARLAGLRVEPWVGPSRSSSAADPGPSGRFGPTRCWLEVPLPPSATNSSSSARGPRPRMCTDAVSSQMPGAEIQATVRPPWDRRAGTCGTSC